MPASQENRQISVKSALPADVLLFSSMNSSEQLGRLPEYRVQLLSTDSDIKIGDVLGTPMCIDLELTGGTTRHFHGIVTRFCSTGWNGEYARYEAIIHPWLWLLKKSSNCRIFQGMTVPDIVKSVCSTYGGLVSLSADGLTAEYPALIYCVQYRETDFDFVCRLLEDAGIYFYFTCTDDSHTMVLADSYNTHEDIDGYDSLKFTNSKKSGGLIEETVSQWVASGEIQSSSYAMNDYNFEKSQGSTSGGMKSISTIAAAFEQTAYEMYDYPGQYVDAAHGDLLAKARLERLHGQCELIDARSDARGLFAGGLFTLADHPRDDQNRKYLVTGARYQINGGDYTSGGSADMNVECRFTAIGHTFPYRPSAVIAKPIVQGPQTAIVVGKAGEEIWTDEHGRIKVQFHWDRLGGDDEQSSCWVRVSQTWAGKGWGAFTLPRIGMEVVVSFLEGDPDRPLVTGCVYNSDAMPPYALPANQTRSTFKTNSSKGGGGYNELRFEDKKGAEEIYMQAERDFNRVVKNNDTLKVGFEVAKAGNQTIDIKNNQDTTVGADQTLTVGHDQTDHIKNDQFETIDNNQTLKVGVDCKRTIGNDQVVSIGNNDTRTTGNNQVVKIGNDAALTIGNNSKVDIATNHTKTIGSNDSIKVGANREVAIGSNQTVSIGSNHEVTIGSNQKTDVGASDELSVGSSQKIKIGASQTIDVGAGHTISAGTTIEISAGASIEFVCGASSIKLEPAKITISSVLVEIEGKAAMKLDTAIMKVSASGPMAISGAIVKIN
jgi:type VI secretion system secreted protein VgrG